MAKKQAHKKSVGQEIIRALEGHLDDLKAGRPLKVTVRKRPSKRSV